VTRIVCIGGGHGLAVALAAARQVADEVTAVVTAADDGGSSGVLRKWLGIPAPGDIRMALAALAADEEDAALLQYRFTEGSLEGHPLGNLIIAALADLRGDFASAVEETGRIVRTQGQVWPASPVPVTLAAIMGGHEIRGQVSIAEGPGPVSQLWLEPADVAATPQAVEAIERADLVLAGPGSLFTSVLAALLVPAIGVATRQARRVALVLNLSEQVGESLGLDAAAHVAALMSHVRKLRIDVVLAHDGSGERVPRPIRIDESTVAAPVFRADLASEGTHDATKLASALKQLL
jgi:uncharacterized cofD-like protein